MDGPRRRAVGALTAGILGISSVLAQDPGIPPTGTVVPKVIPPRSGPPVTVTVSPLGNSPLPPTGVPIGTPIPVGIPAGTLLKTIPPANGTPTAVETSFPKSSLPTASLPSATTPSSMTISPIQSPYFGYYPTQWRTFPDQAFPAFLTPSQSLSGQPISGQPLPTYPPNLTSSDTPPPVVRVTPPKTEPNTLPINLQMPTETVSLPTQPPLLPPEEVRTVSTPIETKIAEQPLATMGRPRLSSVPDPVTPNPVTPVSVPPAAPQILPPLIPVLQGPSLTPLPTKNSLLPVSVIDVPFVPAPAIPTPVDTAFGIEQTSGPKSPLKVRPPVEPSRPKFSEDSTIRPAAPVIRAWGTGG